MTIDENNEIAQGNQTLTSFLKVITGVDPVNNCSTKNQSFAQTFEHRAPLQFCLYCTSFIL